MARIVKRNISEDWTAGTILQLPLPNILTSLNPAAYFYTFRWPICMFSNSGCRECFEKLMWEHINNEHRKKSPAHYSFCYWNIHAKDISENEINKKLHSIYPKDWWITILLERKCSKFRTKVIFTNKFTIQAIYTNKF